MLRLQRLKPAPRPAEHPLLRARPEMGRTAQIGLAVAALGVSSLAPRSSHAQSGVDPSGTGIYARIGLVYSHLNLGSMNFAAQDRRMSSGSTRPQRFDGKFLGWDESMGLGGLSAGVAFDARWFYVRVGADIYEFPNVTGPGDAANYRARFTTLAWMSAGPRLRVGPVVLNAGLRVGAMIVNVTHRTEQAEYSAVDGIYALDVGAQWRPFRWLELDVAVGHDPFSQINATTFSIGASFGWSRGATRR